MKVYKLVGHVTIHDVAHQLGRPRQTIMRWVKALGIEYTIISQGHKLVATFIPQEAVKALKAQSAQSLVAASVPPRKKRA